MRLTEAKLWLQPSKTGELEAHMEAASEWMAKVTEALRCENADPEVAARLQRAAIILARDASQLACSLGLSIRSRP